MALLLLLSLVYACEGTSVRPRTQLVLVADTDIAELSQAIFEITGPDGTMQRATGNIAPGVPAYVVLSHESRAALEPYRVQVTGMAADQPVITRSASVGFVSGGTRTVPLHLAASCREPSCEGELVCSAEGCRAELIMESELLPWTGSPPTLVAVADAGTADADAIDAEAADAAAGCVPTCEGNAERLCQDGNLLPPRPCMSTDPCNTNACQPGIGCVATPTADGLSCGNGGLACQAGVCGAGQACTKMCNPQCKAGTKLCTLDCGATGQDCMPVCVAGASCAVQCTGISNCTVSCAGDCDVSCGDASNCATTCRTGSHCEVDCREDTNCDKARCQPGAQCVLRCGENDSCKAMEWCMGGVLTDCGGGTWVCNRSCPVAP